MLNDMWLLPPVNLTLPYDEVHVWQAELDLPTLYINRLRTTLTVDEIDKSNRFHFEKEQKRFIVGRGLLRIILGHYLDLEPGCLHFSYNQYGKPFLDHRFCQYGFNFNLSHSGGLALYAATRSRAIGVDIERIRTNFEYEEIAEQFFSPSEAYIFRTIPVEMKPEAFFNCWTRKEAYIKAHGNGLSLPLDSFDVSFIPGDPAMLLSVRDKSEESSHWTLLELKPKCGYASALAVKGSDWKLKTWQWLKESLFQV